MFDTKKAILYQALNVWANYIETGDVSMSAADVSNCKRGSVKVLSLDQMRLLIKIKDLQSEVLAFKVFDQKA